MELIFGFSTVGEKRCKAEDIVQLECMRERVEVDIKDFLPARNRSGCQHAVSTQ
jgi:hypothetical protein